MYNLSTNSPIHAASKRPTRCRHRKKATTTQRTRSFIGNGFLNYSFPAVRENNAALQNAVQVETEFFKSLAHLTNLYKIALPINTEYPFPLNIAEVYKRVKDMLNQVNPLLELIIIQDDNHAACLATVDSLTIGNTLYYIPVQAVYRLLKKKANMPMVRLILSVFAYLYQVVRIPYYRDSSSYMHYCYERMIEWYFDSSELTKKELQENQREFNQLRKGGDRVLNEIRKAIHLRTFGKRVAKFIPKDNWESSLLQVAATALTLWQSAPQRPVFSSIPEGLLYPEIEERLRPDCYLSFYWESNDHLYSMLMEYINSDLQEYGVIDEPVSIQLFDSPQCMASHDLQFEKKLFQLMDDLCELLNKIP